MRTVMRHLPLFLLVGALLVLLTVFMRRLARSVTQPLARLQTACEDPARGLQPGDGYARRDEPGHLTETFNTMARKIDDLIHEGYEKDLAATRLELQMLRLQINPHFLYNTLESIHSVAYLEGNREVGEMAVLLARSCATVFPRREGPLRSGMRRTIWRTISVCRSFATGGRSAFWFPLIRACSPAPARG